MEKKDSQTQLTVTLVLVGFFKVILLGIVSWLLLHFFALVGFFVALSLPLWWLFFPRRIPCIGCQTREEGEYCPLCGKEVREGSPRSFRSMAAHMGIFLLLFLVSLGVIYAEREILEGLDISLTPKTATFEIPPRAQYRLGEIFPMRITLTGIKRSINAVQADFSFDPRRLELVEISTRESFASVFIQKEIDNKTGYGRLAGGVPSPGFSQERGVFGTVYFRGKTPGLADVEFLPSSMILANDGRGTNVLKGLASSHYLVLPEEVLDTERELQESALILEVLGTEEERKEQMLFFEPGEKVLGGDVEEDQITPSRTFGLGRSLLRVLNRFNRLVINFWREMFAFVFSS
ncbi:MAG: cohesin domain-containing protein [Patescibacteria group bacterium]|nr:cohesin domain-containing protein [Patescibacteria group bacterium]